MSVTSLRGVRTVHVVIETLPAAAVAAGVDTSTFQTAVELRLREAGLRVVGSGAIDDGTLYVQVTPVETNVPGYWALGLNVLFLQAATLRREPHAPVFVSTWGASGVHAAGVKVLDEAIRKDIDRYVDQFLNVWLEANPKGQ
jgi:hypothetical protein